eukprot:scaffold207119_cov28-Tisochrysis_lutea.AAC.1
MTSWTRHCLRSARARTIRQTRCAREASRAPALGAHEQHTMAAIVGCHADQHTHTHRSVARSLTMKG